MSINWYMALYYKYRDYPVSHINSKYKRNELKNIYASIFTNLSQYFYIDVQEFETLQSGQVTPSLPELGSSKKIIDGYSAGVSSSLHSRFFQSTKRIAGKKLKSQMSGDEGKLNGNSMASINRFKGQDSAIDEFDDNKMENMANFLRLVLNTSKEIICGILMQQQDVEKDSNYDIADEESSLEHNQTSKSEIKSESYRKCPQAQIEIEVIPSNNQQINYYFLEFCSGIEIKDPQTFPENEPKLITQKSMSKLEDRSFMPSQTEQTSLKDLISKKNGIKGLNGNFDQILLQIMQKELAFSNCYLNKFQNQGNGASRSDREGIGSVNIIIETWLELVTMVEDEKMLYEITEELVKGSGNPFSEKVSSYLHFTCLVKTKSLLARTVSKENFLWFIPDFLSGTRSLQDFKLGKKGGFVTIYDVPLDRPMYSSEAFSKALKRWQHVGRIISELLIQNESIFWAKILQSCCELLDRYLQQKVQFSYSLILLSQHLDRQDPQTCPIQMPAPKKSFYQHTIKSIIEREIEDGSSQFPSGLSRSQIRSKNSVGKAGSGGQVRNRSSVFVCEDHHFVFYGEKAVGKEEKILEIRQWEKVVLLGIQRLRGYRKILDAGLDIFEGTPELVTIFFLENYFNFKKIQVLTSFNFLQTVTQYCTKIQNPFPKPPEEGPDIHPFIKPILLQLQTHKQNHKQISKQIATAFRSKQLTAATLGKQVSGVAGYQDRDRERDKESVGDGEEGEREGFGFGNGEERVFGDCLPVLREGVVLGALDRLRSKKKEDFELTNVEDLLLIGQINKHIKLINECNFILNLIQTSQHPSTPTPKPLLPTPPPPLLLLTSLQLSTQISKQILQHQTQTKSLLMQTQYTRKNSSQNKAHRLSSINAQKKTIVQVPGTGMGDGEGQLDAGKVRGRVGLHNGCLEGLVRGYCRGLGFFGCLLRNLGCQACCGFGEDAGERRVPGLITKNRTGKPLESQYERRYREMASKKMLTYVKKYQQLIKNSSTITVEQLQKQLTQQIESNNFNNEILMMFMFIASLHVDNETFLAIYKQDLISAQRMDKIKVIGKAYFQAIHSLYTRAGALECGKLLREQNLRERKDLYMENLLVIVVALVQMLYDRTEECVDLTAYTRLLMNYFISKASATSNKEKTKQNEELINLNKIISQCFDWNEQGKPEMGEKELLAQLLELRTSGQSESFSKHLRSLIEDQFKVLRRYEGSNGRVEYLQKKLLYLMLREVYFNSYYDVGIFELKSMQAKKNFAMYEDKMISFFQEIITKDQQEFIQKKSEQLKQRSAHLKGYLVDYEKEPSCYPEQKGFLMKIVCIFDKTLNLLTENREFQMKKRGSNSISVLRKNKKKVDPIYMHYVSTEYIKPNKQRVKVFENQGFYFFRAIEIYEDMLSKKVEDSEKKYSIYKELGFSVPTSICNGFLEGDMQIIKQSKESLLALWINYEYKNLHERKMMLSHQNYLSKIEKLYIDLDVRHKVFESFKDKILNYEMQKTKIYHQYMDYIRGLKLDVYSHVSGQDPIPYFKLINAIKIYRLNIKKKELEEKIDQEFGKNLSKWNEGIVRDMKDYHEWVTNEMKVWEKMNDSSKKCKKELFQIYGIVNKELKKQQNKTINTAESAMKAIENISRTGSKASIRKSLHKQKSLFR